MQITQTGIIQSKVYNEQAFKNFKSNMVGMGFAIIESPSLHIEEDGTVHTMMTIDFTIKTVEFK